VANRYDAIVTGLGGMGSASVYHLLDVASTCLGSSSSTCCTGKRLLITSGSVEGGPEDGTTFRGALHAAELHDLPHEVLDADELRRRYPATCHDIGLFRLDRFARDADR